MLARYVRLAELPNGCVSARDERPLSDLITNLG